MLSVSIFALLLAGVIGASATDYWYNYNTTLPNFQGWAVLTSGGHKDGLHSKAVNSVYTIGNSNNYYNGYVKGPNNYQSTPVIQCKITSGGNPMTYYYSGAEYVTTSLVGNAQYSGLFGTQVSGIINFND